MRIKNHKHKSHKTTNNAYLLVRAIVDGNIIYTKEGTKPNSNNGGPQNYHPQSKHDIGWSDDCIVVIEHENEIGAGKDAPHTPTTVKLYCLYMHPGSLARQRTSIRIF